MNGMLLSSVVAMPFLAALVLLFVPDRKRLLVRIIALAGAGYSLLASCLVAFRYEIAEGGFQMGETYAIAPAFGIAFRFAADGWSVSLLLLTGLVIVGGVLASWSLDERSKSFFITLLVLVTGVFGVFVTQDLFVFFLFYEIAVLPMYLLIGIWGSSHAIGEAGPFRFVWRVFNIGAREYAAMKLTLMLLVGSAVIIAVMLALYLATGESSFDMRVLGAFDYDRSMQLWCFPLCWLGFGALAGVFPFHTWSPDGHASAPTAVSMLHAGVLMKLGAFGVMRVGFMMMPEGAIVWAPVIGTVAVINIIYGALAAMSQRDLKYVVAYSSVSHMGIVMLGAATLTVDGWNGAVYQMFAHGLMTGLFFALVGLVYERAHTRHMPSMGGFGALMPGVATFFTLACLSSLGLPGTAGFVAEILVFIGAWKSLHPWWAIPGILGALITAIYVLRAARRIFWGEGPAEEFRELSDAKGPEWGALAILGGCIVLFGFLPSLVLDFINRATPQYLSILTQLMEPR